MLLIIHDVKLFLLRKVCQKIAEGAQRHYIQEQDSPYITYADQWVGYDDMDSLAIKVSIITDVLQQEFKLSNRQHSPTSV
jgi:hypothetical protein